MSQFRFGGSNFIPNARLVNTSEIEKQRLLSTIEAGKRTGGVLSSKPPGFDSQRHLSTTVYENVTVGAPLSAEQVRALIGRRL